MKKLISISLAVLLFFSVVLYDGFLQMFFEFADEDMIGVGYVVEKDKDKLMEKEGEKEKDKNPCDKSCTKCLIAGTDCPNFNETHWINELNDFA
jgi:hypothetical protein